MEIKIFGSGCAKCVKLSDNAAAAAKHLGIEVTINKITDTNAIVDAGVIRTPALAIGEEVVVMGRVASPEEIERLLAQTSG